MKRAFLSVLLMLTTLLFVQGRKVETLNFGWEFSRDSLFTEVQQVDLPHDFQIGQSWVAPTADEKADNSDAAANIKSRLSARGFKEMGTGWYRKVIRKEQAEVRDKRLLLDFEGIMLVGDIYLNGQRIGGTPSPWAPALTVPSARPASTATLRIPSCAKATSTTTS